VACFPLSSAHLGLMKERPEKTQKGNPHGLTVRQHVFPRASIERFATGGGVEVHDLKRRTVRRAGPDDDLFCADRAWAHGPEAGWMKEVEDAFQAVAEEALRRRPPTLNDRQSGAISEFYALWQARAECRHLPMQTIPASPDVLAMRRDYTADELELLEKNGISAFRGDGSMQLRHIMGPVIRLAMDRIKAQMVNRRWSLVEAPAGEFCVPDVPAHGIIPLTPSIALHSTRAGTASINDVAEINAVMGDCAREYLFARSLADCPGISHLSG